jgi:DNA-binding transcriptional ArsR family regulator
MPRRGRGALAQGGQAGAARGAGTAQVPPPLTECPMTAGISDVGVSQPTVSHHLKKLKEAGLPTSERRGTRVHHRVEPSVPAAMARLPVVARTG